eukprot:6211993-Pleurochrysis_carterae.AAC.1
MQGFLGPCGFFSLLALIFPCSHSSGTCQLIITDAHFEDGSSAMDCVNGIRCATLDATMHTKLSFSSASLQVVVYHSNGTLIANSLTVVVPLPSGETHTCALLGVQRTLTRYVCSVPDSVSVSELQLQSRASPINMERFWNSVRGVRLWSTQRCGTIYTSSHRGRAWDALAVILIILCFFIPLIAYRGFIISKRVMRRAEEGLEMVLAHTLPSDDVVATLQSEAEPEDGLYDTRGHGEAVENTRPLSSPPVDETHIDMKTTNSSRAAHYGRIRASNERTTIHHEVASSPKTEHVKKEKDSTAIQQEHRSEDDDVNNERSALPLQPILTFDHQLDPHAAASDAPVFQRIVNTNETCQQKTNDEADGDVAVAPSIRIHDDRQDFRSNGHKGERRTPRRSAHNQRRGSPSARQHKETIRRL